MFDCRRWSERLFRLLMRAYPKSIRAQRAADMWLTFRDHLDDARAAGRAAVVTLWWREIFAVWRARRRPRISAVQPGQAQPAQRPTHTKREFLLGVSLLDFKLGFRMLVKYPGLTVVGGLGITVAIAVGVGAFGFIDSFANPTLPFPQGHRLVTIENWDVERNRLHDRILHDIVTWREEARAIDDLGAVHRLPGRNLVTADGRVELVRLAVMSSAGFRVTRVPPLMGRTLQERDEAIGAPAVVVLGYEIWREVLAADPEAIGTRVRLGGIDHTVVGVMPEGYAFPVHEDAWTPLRLDSEAYERGAGPSLITFGRLADGATMSDARAELTAIGQRAAVTYPDTHRALRPRVMPYALPFLDIDDPQMVWLLRLWQFIMSLVLVVVCVNVAILVYARTAMRQREIGIRTALGASRKRVVTQLFVEAFVLSAAAALLGVMAAYVAVEKVDAFQKASASASMYPHWLELGLSVSSIVYACGLVVLSGVIVGVVPGLKATGRDVHTNLQRLSGGGAPVALGGTWTLLIVTQVAVAVAGLPVAAYQSVAQIRAVHVEPGFPADEFVTAKLVVKSDWPGAGQLGARGAAVGNTTTLGELVRRLEDEPLVRSATYSGFHHGRGRAARVELDEMEARTGDGTADGGRRGRFVFVNTVAVDFFDAFDTPLLAGRQLVEGDLNDAAATVIVNRSFANRIVHGGNPVGRRIRYVDRSGNTVTDTTAQRSYEIVGVVDDFGTNPNTGAIPMVYTAIAPERLDEAYLAIRMHGNDVAKAATRLREIVATVDPTMQLHTIQSEGFALRQERRAMLGLVFVVGATMLCVVLLSSAGIYALMSFTVTQRRREIGIRTALGGQARRILLDIFTRAVAQLSVGVFAGVAAAALLNQASGGFLLGGRAVMVLALGSAGMMAVGFAAAMGPARRGLRVQPSEALKGAD